MNDNVVTNNCRRSKTAGPLKIVGSEVVRRYFNLTLSISASMNVEGEFRKLVSSNTWMQNQLFLHALFLHEPRFNALHEFV